MELRQLHYLTVIAEEENLGRAARRLFVSQPALSYALKSLESELGVRLFDRHAGGVSATAAGHDVIAEALLTVRQSERVSAAAERHTRGDTGVLRVGFEASGAGELTTRARGVRPAPPGGSGGAQALRLGTGGRRTARRPGRCRFRLAAQRPERAAQRAGAHRAACRGTVLRARTGGPYGHLGARSRRRATDVDAARAAGVGGLVGGQPQAGRFESELGPDQ